MQAAENYPNAQRGAALRSPPLEANGKISGRAAFSTAPRDYGRPAPRHPPGAPLSCPRKQSSVFPGILRWPRPSAGLFLSGSLHTTRNQSSRSKLWVRRSWGGTPMENLSIRVLLLLTCLGAFVASATYAVTLLH
jgi:hypothetical protein